MLSVLVMSGDVSAPTCTALRRVLALLLFAWAVGSSAPSLAQQARTKIVFDTDIGTDIDDAWALGYVLKSPSLELVGVTISDGDTAARARLACKLLARLGRTDVPVSVGRPTPAIPADRIDYQFAWAEDFRDYAPVRSPAVEFLADMIRKHPREITLVAVGPLHNLGDLVRLHPDIVPLVKRVVLMSGSIGASYYSATAVTEWNVKLAIPEAQAVYAAAWPVTIVPLDATSYVRLEDAERDTLRKSATPLAVALETLLRLWTDRSTSRMALHDQLALAETQEPGRFFGRCDPLPLVVSPDGYTRVDRERGRPVRVCLEPRRNEFMTHFLAQIGSR
jgi:inosine-uridine nucleoside N-ribohydrolase